ncbi:hypothetical protein [Nocardioides sp. GY 10127]|uniref:hypothetical protein n=1 Tax=Nocardioides sp. GY 10127 TaxID=2569762 RepID=UPI0014584845|nr:hypothetical protein [Nocardioides sp. GY 10127]
MVSPSLQPGRFDSLAVDCPFVFSVDGRTGMTYVGWDGDGYQTALSWLEDERWTPGELVLPRDPADPLTRWNAALTSILRENDLWSGGELRRVGGWYLATFHAYPGAGYEAGPGSIGFLRSRDLHTWERVGGVLRPEDGAEWERGGLYKSWLLEHDGLFHLFYNAKQRDEWPWVEQTGLAVSHDLETWTRVSENPVLPVGADGDFDEVFASDPCVLRDGDQWVMFYFGLAEDGHAREGVATSPDLRTWTKSGDVLIDVGPEGAIDSLYAHKPAVVTRDGRLEHYYCAVARRPPHDVGDRQITESRGITRAVRDLGAAAVHALPVDETSTFREDIA